MRQRWKGEKSAADGKLVSGKDEQVHSFVHLRPCGLHETGRIAQHGRSTKKGQAKFKHTKTCIHTKIWRVKNVEKRRGRERESCGKCMYIVGTRYQCKDKNTGDQLSGFPPSTHFTPLPHLSGNMRRRMEPALGANLREMLSGLEDLRLGNLHVLTAAGDDEDGVLATDRRLDVRGGFTAQRLDFAPWKKHSKTKRTSKSIQ